ncbi:hypothetical protein ITP53_14390 [Nonomuraea sp. K274]|uniref:Dehydratase n=1 Tax=Nonomuraea cypriaca TaxID=1187855 RepID=A0A931EYV7_9ACTN|nr:hypothetical protein [Nonomuraea cypriaca]MBF8186907.1 hypothetical protein [Nonomuraea cypriaca]
MALGLALVAGGASAVPANAATAAAAATPVSFACRGDWPFDNLFFTNSQTVNVSVPSSVARGATFSGTGSSGAFVVPKWINGEIPVTELRDFTLTLVMSGPGAISGATLSGGANLGPGPRTVTTTSTTVTMKVAGPLPAGTTVTLPSIKITGTAGNTTGTIRLKIAGTDYANPGLRITSVVPVDPDPPIIASSSCYPSPSPVLSSTNVT